MTKMAASMGRPFRPSATILYPVRAGIDRRGIFGCGAAQHLGGAHRGKASFDDDAAIAMLLVASAAGLIVLMMVRRFCDRVSDTAHDPRDQVQGLEAFRGVDLGMPKPATTSMPPKRHRFGGDVSTP